MSENVNNEAFVSSTESFVNASKPNKIKKYTPIIIYVCITLLLSCISSFITAKLVLNNSASKVVVYEASESNTKTVITETDYSGLVKDVENTIVEVYTEMVTYSAYWGNYVTDGAGSGVIYSSDGYIITNHHVIEGATTVNVTLHNGEKYEAEIIASDNISDLAVIKINATGLQSVVIGNSDNLAVGQKCVAIGNPLGTLGGTVTTGIISALSREVTVENIPMTLLQTDAAISPGNSGGGLFNTSGELIGIVNAKSSGDSTEGIGFAIPSNNVKTIIQELIEKGYVTGRPQLGIKAISVESVNTAWQLGVNSYGVYVSEILSESTKNAGLQVGDVIIGINDVQVGSLTALQAQLLKYEVGQVVKISVVRGRNTIMIDITLISQQ